MTSKLSVVAAIALAAIVSVPGASYAASKHKSSDTGLTNPATCTGGGCTAQNPDRVVQPCNGSQCYKKTRKHKPASASAK
jgi:hypothetical protein